MKLHVALLVIKGMTDRHQLLSSRTRSCASRYAIHQTQTLRLLCITSQPQQSSANKEDVTRGSRTISGHAPHTAPGTTMIVRFVLWWIIAAAKLYNRLRAFVLSGNEKLTGNQPLPGRCSTIRITCIYWVLMCILFNYTSKSFVTRYFIANNQLQLNAVGETAQLSVHGGRVANALGFNARGHGFAPQPRRYLWD